MLIVLQKTVVHKPETNPYVFILLPVKLEAYHWRRFVGNQLPLSGVMNIITCHYYKWVWSHEHRHWWGSPRVKIINLKLHCILYFFTFYTYSFTSDGSPMSLEKFQQLDDLGTNQQHKQKRTNRGHTVNSVFLSIDSRSSLLYIFHMSMILTGHQVYGNFMHSSVPRQR